MPYIDPARRVAINQGEIPKNAGELNYLLTTNIRLYLGKKGESYQTYNDILGVLSAMPLELYRRKIAQYEDKKKDINGDVYL